MSLLWWKPSNSYVYHSGEKPRKSHILEGYFLLPTFISLVMSLNTLFLNYSAPNTLARLLFLEYSGCGDPSQSLSFMLPLLEDFSSSSLRSLLSSLGFCSYYLFLPIRIIFLLSIMLISYLFYVFFLELIILEYITYVFILYLIS